MIRTPEALIPYIFALAAFLAGLAWHLADSIPHMGQTVVSGQIAVGGPFHLVDQDGAPRDDRDFRGRWMFVYFGYTHCPDVCPLTLSLMSDVMQRLGSKAARLTPVFITVASFGKDFVGLTGDAKSIALVEKEYRVAAIRHPLPGGDYAMDHSGTIYLMDPGGRFAMDYDDSTKPDDIAADIAKRL
jgi:protein SCO1/2